MDLQESDILGDNVKNHWYYRAKAGAMLFMLKRFSFKKILDVGAGSGFFSKYLLSHTLAEMAYCVDTSYAQYFEENEHGKKIEYHVSISNVEATLVLMMDVLEHVDDDIGLLKNYIEKVPSGSRFLITVPAFRFMWSGHDDFLGHRRRYTLRQLESVVRESGLSVENSCYFFSMIFPIAFITRMLQKVKTVVAKSQLCSHHPFVNGILFCLCRLEIPFMTFNKLGGLSVFCLAKKE